MSYQSGEGGGRAARRRRRGGSEKVCLTPEGGGSTPKGRGPTPKEGGERERIRGIFYCEAVQLICDVNDMIIIRIFDKISVEHKSIELIVFLIKLLPSEILINPSILIVALVITLASRDKDYFRRNSVKLKLIPSELFSKNYFVGINIRPFSCNELSMLLNENPFICCDKNM